MLFSPPEEKSDDRKYVCASQANCNPIMAKSFKEKQKLLLQHYPRADVQLNVR